MKHVEVNAMCCVLVGCIYISDRYVKIRNLFTYENTFTDRR